MSSVAEEYRIGHRHADWRRRHQSNFHPYERPELRRSDNRPPRRPLQRVPEVKRLNPSRLIVARDVEIQPNRTVRFSGAFDKSRKTASRSCSAVASSHSPAIRRRSMSLRRLLQEEICELLGRSYRCSPIASYQNSRQPHTRPPLELISTSTLHPV